MLTLLAITTQATIPALSATDASDSQNKLNSIAGRSEILRRFQTAVSLCLLQDEPMVEPEHMLSTRLWEDIALPALKKVRLLDMHACHSCLAYHACV